MQARAVWFLVLAILAAAALGIGASFAARAFGAETNTWVSMATAMVVGTFLAVLLMPRKKRPAKTGSVEGFRVLGGQDEGKKPPEI